MASERAFLVMRWRQRWLRLVRLGGVRECNDLNLSHSEYWNVTCISHACHMTCHMDVVGTHIHGYCYLVCFLELAEFLCEVSIVRVKMFLLQTTVHQHMDHLPLLHLL